MAQILIVDDDAVIRSVLSKKILRLGHDVDVAESLAEGLNLAKTGRYDVIFLDVRLPDGCGLDALPAISNRACPPEVIIITGESDPDGAELALRNGAWDYVQKPSSLKSMVFPMIRALEYRETKLATTPLKALRLDGIIGSSPALRTCLDQLAQAAESEMSVLICGETGTGKELFARALHDNSRRHRGPFVTVDCTALPENLVEAELFGSTKGAYTGASMARDGLVLKADKGTLFLDEVGELPLGIQKKFLRVLQEHSFRQVGGTMELKSDFRVVCATNRNLDEMVQAGTFRQDLLYRLKSMLIELPPLRKRGNDIKELTIHHLARISERYAVKCKGFSPEFIESLALYEWPGNVRELVNTLENTLIAARDEPTLFPQHLPLSVRIAIKKSSLRFSTAALTMASGLEPGHEPDPVPEMDEPANGPAHEDPPGAPLPCLRDLREQTISEMELRYLKKLLARTGSDLGAALRISGLSRSRYYELLKKHNMTVQQ